MSVDLGFRVSYLRIRFSLITVGFGLFVFLVGSKPNWFGWDRSPVVGFIQIAVFLIGLAFICLGGYVGLIALWGKEQRSIVADIGLRLISTGYVIAVFAGMAGVFGMGSQPLQRGETESDNEGRPRRFETARARSRTGAGHSPVWGLGALVSWL